jgi:hypothetical protein
MCGCSRNPCCRSGRRVIDIETYDRHAEKLREELTLARIDESRSTETALLEPP